MTLESIKRAHDVTILYILEVIENKPHCAANSHPRQPRFHRQPWGPIRSPPTPDQLLIRYNTQMLTRRNFLTASSAALATRLFAAPPGSKTPNADLEKLGAVALSEARKYKATYADIRIVRISDQRIGLRLSP